MGNKQGSELSPEEKQKLREERARDKAMVKGEKERKKKEKKDMKRRKKKKKQSDNEDESDGGSEAWSEKSQISGKSADERSVGSAPGSWYHSASEPSSRRSSIYMPASAGPGYYQHDCWYAAYEDSGSEHSKSRSRTPSVKDLPTLRKGSLERYPLGVPAQKAIDPIHRSGSLERSSVGGVGGTKDLKAPAGRVTPRQAITPETQTKFPQVARAPEANVNGVIARGEKRKTPFEAENIMQSSELPGKRLVSDRILPLYARRRERSPEPTRRGGEVSGSDVDDPRRPTYDRSSVGGSIYYSADEGESVAGSVYYSLTSGSEMEDAADEKDFAKGDRPSPPSQPEAVDRDGGALSSLAYFRVENDALLLRWDAPVTDGGSPITGYIIERSEAVSDFWMRVNLVPVKELEYAIAHLQGGRDYRFRVSAENAMGMSDPSPPSELVSVTSDQEATEPHFLRELRDVVALENQKVEFSVDVVGTPTPDVTWYKDGFEVYDTKAFEFLHVGERYSLIMLRCQVGDEGDIRVKATNRVGVASSQATLRIEAAPRMQSPPEYEEGLIFDSDELIRLRVPYIGRPQPLALWTHNGRTIEIDERRSVDVSDKYVTLKIAGANRNDKGMYTVKLKNARGEDSASFFVTVTDRPGPPGKPSFSEFTGGQSLTLRWDPPREDGGCRVNNYIVEYFRIGWDVWLKATSSSVTWAELSDLIVGSEYRFRIKAENAYGISDPSPESLQVLIEESRSDQGSFDSTATPSPAIERKLLKASPNLFADQGSEVSSEAGSFDVDARRSFLLEEETPEKFTYIENVVHARDDEPVMLPGKRKLINQQMSPTSPTSSSDTATEIQEVESLSGFRHPEASDSDVEGFLGDYMNRWEAYGGKTLDLHSPDRANVLSEEETGYFSQERSNIDDLRALAEEIEEQLVEKEGVFPFEAFQEERIEKHERQQKLAAEKLKLQTPKSPPKSKSPKPEVIYAIPKKEGKKKSIEQTEIEHGQKERTQFADEGTEFHEDEQRLYENVTDDMIFKRGDDFLIEKLIEAQTMGMSGNSKEYVRSLGKEPQTHEHKMEHVERVEQPQNLRSLSPTSNLLAIPGKQHKGGKNLPRKTPSPLPFSEENLKTDIQPTPPPRRKRSSSRTSDVSDSSSFLDVALSNYGFDTSEGGLESPKPPPRSKRSSSRTSITSDTSLLDVPLSNFDVHDDRPTPPARAKRSSSRVSNVSQTESLEMEIVPMAPPRAKRTGSRISNLSDADNIAFIDYEESSPAPTPPRRLPRTGVLSLTPSTSVTSESAASTPTPVQGAPDSTPSPNMETLAHRHPRASMKGSPTPRKRSFIYNGYPGEDPLVERRNEEELDPSDALSSVANRVPENTSNSERFRRPSFLAEYLRASPEGESSNGDFQEELRKENGTNSSTPSQSLIRKYFGDLEDRLFDVFGDKDARTINVFKFFTGLLETGLRLKDPRLREMVEGLRKMQEKFAANEERSFQMDFDVFLGIISHNLEIVVKAFSNAFVIPDFLRFAQLIDELYYSCKNNKNGKPAAYIPQLSRVSKDKWGVSVCTVDGQRHSIGDVNVPFTIQSCSKPLTYAIAAGECSPTYFHSFVGMEPSGRYFNELCLDHNNKPHNPMINAGAIMTAALIKPELTSADRFEFVFNEYKRLCGGEYLGFNNGVFLSERECADRNFALAYFMRENKCFPEGTKLKETLDFYFQLCSLEITAESGAVMAATLANGGINPLTGEAILSVEAVRNTLTLMHSCGMYNYSGQFAFKVGLPAKSGVSGCILLVVPNTLGICLWSPPLDSNGNSCRGVQFCMELVSKFKFHHFDNLRGHICNKIDPRTGKNESKAQILFDLLFSVAAGDLSSLKRLLLQREYRADKDVDKHAMTGTNLDGADYDGRTALHVAASEGHSDIVEFLLDKCNVKTDSKDRWGRTALDDARQFGHTLCEKLIEKTIHLRSLNLNFCKPHNHSYAESNSKQDPLPTVEIKISQDPNVTKVEQATETLSLG